MGKLTTGKTMSGGRRCAASSRTSLGVDSTSLRRPLGRTRSGFGTRSGHRKGLFSNGLPAVQNKVLQCLARSISAC